MSVSVYDLRSLFPYSSVEFPSPEGAWLCRLAEVSDLRPDDDRLSWYLVFEPGTGWHGQQQGLRKLEIVTSAGKLIQEGFPPEAETRISNWIASNEQDGRVEWPDV